MSTNRVCRQHTHPCLPVPTLGRPSVLDHVWDSFCLPAKSQAGSGACAPRSSTACLLSCQDAVRLRQGRRNDSQVRPVLVYLSPFHPPPLEPTISAQLPHYAACQRWALDPWLLLEIRFFIVSGSVGWWLVVD